MDLGELTLLSQNPEKLEEYLNSSAFKLLPYHKRAEILDRVGRYPHKKFN